MILLDTYNLLYPVDTNLVVLAKENVTCIIWDMFTAHIILNHC